MDAAPGTAEGGNMRNDKLIDPRPLHLRMCCGEMPIVRQFRSLGCYAIECRISGHIHNSGLCDTLKQACKEWNSKEPKEGN